MGKRLVISGADFSANGMPYVPTLVWYIDTCTSSPARGRLSNANLENGGWAFKSTENAYLQGKTINRIKLIPSAAGALNIYRTTSYSGSVALLATINIPSSDIGNMTTYEINDINIAAGDIFVIGEANSVGGFKFVDAGSSYPGFYTKVPSNPTAVGAQFDLNISIGYYG